MGDNKPVTEIIMTAALALPVFILVGLLLIAWRRPAVLRWALPGGLLLGLTPLMYLGLTLLIPASTDAPDVFLGSFFVDAALVVSAVGSACIVGIFAAVRALAKANTPKRARA